MADAALKTIKEVLGIKSIQKGASDSTLCALARKAALLHWGGCLVCGATEEGSDIDGHHFVPRSNRLLRWDWRNVFPACRLKGCHDFLASKKGQDFIRKLVGKRWYDMLAESEHKTLRAHLVETGLSKNEFKHLMKKKSQDKIAKEEAKHEQ